jgi:ribosome biogenesis GTPase
LPELAEIGWGPFFDKAFQETGEAQLEAGRVAVEHRDGYDLYTVGGVIQATAAGKLHFNAESKSDLPKVGDWVLFSRFDDGNAIVQVVLPRRTKFSRKEAGRTTREQILAANIDYIFIVQSLDNNFNPRRLERYLVMVYEGGANPVIILNKTDLSDHPESQLMAATDVAGKVPIIMMSAIEDDDLDKLDEFIRPGITLALIGSSGVGKTTIINRLLGSQLLRTNDVREKDSKGRHTTTRREMILLPKGGLIIDTPGMKELQLWSSDDGLHDTYSDFDALAGDCHFSDCSHLHEKRCAVISAVESGDISEERYASYVKLQKEIVALEERQDAIMLLEKKRKNKSISREIRKFYRERPKRKGQ